MKFVLSVLVSAAVTVATMAVASAQTVPCEDMLTTLRDAEAKASLDEATRAKVADLEAKGVERCNADDDKRADAFFTEAMQLLGK